VGDRKKGRGCKGERGTGWRSGSDVEWALREMVLWVRKKKKNNQTKKEEGE